MTDPESHRDYERVRQQLIERGYLQSRIERFVLVDWTADRFQGRPRWKRSALKAALLAAPFLSAILASLVARSQDPLIATSDWALLWLYLTPLAAIVLTLMNLAVGAVSGVAARRFGVVGSSGARAGLLIGLPILIYLTMLLRSSSDAGRTATEWALIAFVVATVVFVSWLASLVSISSILGKRGGLAEARGRSFWSVAVIIVVATLLLFAWRQMATSGPQQEATAWPQVELLPSVPLVVVGVDGLGAGWVQQWGGDGALPELLQRMSSGVVVPLERRPNAAPPEVWTTMLSGRDASSHGLRAVQGERLPGVKTTLQTKSGSISLPATLRLLLPGRPAPITGSDRRVRTVWEIVGRERPTLAVGWWGSWPALEEPQADRSAWVLSDRLLAKLLSDAPMDRDVWPPQLFDRMRARFEAEQSELRSTFETWRPAALSPALADWLWESYQLDSFNLNAFEELWASAEFEVGFLYLPGLDILRHRVERGGDDQLTALERATALRSYTVWLDQQLARLGRHAEQPMNVAVVGDPGRELSGELEGFIALTGPTMSAGCIEAPISSQGLASLLLGLSGLPTASDMELFEPQSCPIEWRKHPTAVPSFGQRESIVEAAPSAFDDEMIERLRSLGYLN